MKRLQVEALVVVVVVAAAAAAAAAAVAAVVAVVLLRGVRGQYGINLPMIFCDSVQKPLL